MDAKTYTATYGKLAETSRRHPCRICGSPIVWHALNITQHLKVTLKLGYLLSNSPNLKYGSLDNVNIFFQIHKELKLTLKEYYENYICGTEDEEIQAQDSSSEASRPSTSLSLTSVSVDPNRWMNRCLFQCNLCGVQFDSRINFRSHIQTIHNMEYDDYIGNYGDPTILTNLHGCLMCSEMIVNDSEDIAEHLNVAHGT